MPDPATDQPGPGQPRLDQPLVDQPRLDQPRLDQTAGDHDAAESRPSDDTVELDAGPSLADDLLHPDDPAEDEAVGRGDLEQSEPGKLEHDGERRRKRARREGCRIAGLTAPRRTRTTSTSSLDNQKRSRVTTGLLVALIFALGVLAGVLVGRPAHADAGTPRSSTC